ncbi:hypothetical protein AK812_SmicGene44054 [Symbiodinium microadriaticum]|uniref:Uncharacterized protein n=1 Tax=Symbiodinium microadriaticum TaxID=2951 RepID=A0A1Q9BZF9_SYMMI|nr:hypothetical protein AK812_SmicGene44054 [Symbiodinium microadriaticum]
MAETERKEPTELVSCGRCGSVNSVPFGLDRFQCYSCGASVVISRETSAACAAASPTALYIDNLQATPQREGSKSAPSKKPEASSRGFFEKLTRQVDKTLQKVEQSLFSDTPAAGQAPAKAPSALPVGQPIGEEAKAMSPGAREAKPRSPESGGYEERAARAEQLLEAAVAREAVSASERLTLRKQLDDAEQLVSGLSQQLDSVQQEVAEQRPELCRTPPRARAKAEMGRFGQAAEGGRESKEEVVIRELRGTSGKEGRKLPVSFLRFLSRDVALELMQRIAQLEAALGKDGNFDATARPGAAWESMLTTCASVVTGIRSSGKTILPVCHCFAFSCMPP